MSRRAPIVDREVGRAFQNENFAIYNQTASINLVGHWKVSTCDRPVRLLFPKRRRSRPFINTEINVITLMLMFTTPILMWTIGCKMPNKQKIKRHNHHPDRTDRGEFFAYCHTCLPPKSVIHRIMVAAKTAKLHMHDIARQRRSCGGHAKKQLANRAKRKEVRFLPHVITNQRLVDLEFVWNVLDDRLHEISDAIFCSVSFWQFLSDGTARTEGYVNKMLFIWFWFLKIWSV